MVGRGDRLPVDDALGVRRHAHRGAPLGGDGALHRIPCARRATNWFAPSRVSATGCRSTPTRRWTSWARPTSRSTARLMAEMARGDRPVDGRGEIPARSSARCAPRSAGPTWGRAGRWPRTRRRPTPWPCASACWRRTRRSGPFASLVRDLAYRGGHFSTGFLGIKEIMNVLSERGRADLAYRILLSEEFPGVGRYEIKQGATTIWERWDGWTEEFGLQTPLMKLVQPLRLRGRGRMDVLGDGGDRAGGPGLPGDHHPPPPPRATCAIAAPATSARRGRIATEWFWQGGALHLVVRIPPGTTATVCVPCAENAALREGALPACESPRRARGGPGRRLRPVRGRLGALPLRGGWWGHAPVRRDGGAVRRPPSDPIRAINQIAKKGKHKAAVKMTDTLGGNAKTVAEVTALDNRDDVIATLRSRVAGPARARYGVRSLSLFGSWARGEQIAGSDVDVAVTFDDPPDPVGVLRPARGIGCRPGICRWTWSVATASSHWSWERVRNEEMLV